MGNDDEGAHPLQATRAESAAMQAACAAHACRAPFQRALADPVHDCAPTSRSSERVKAQPPAVEPWIGRERHGARRERATRSFRIALWRLERAERVYTGREHARADGRGPSRTGIIAV